MKEKIILAWSGGKDSAFALHELKKSDEYEVAALLTTLTADYDRTSMHGIRRTLLEKQVESVDLPLEKVLISKKSSNEEYESKMCEVLEKCKKKRYFIRGVRRHIFGGCEKIPNRKHVEGGHGGNLSFVEKRYEDALPRVHRRGV